MSFAGKIGYFFFGLGTAQIVGYSYMKAYSERSEDQMSKMLKGHEDFMLSQQLQVQPIGNPYNSDKKSK